jgi:hypothetical protein
MGEGGLPASLQAGVPSNRRGRVIDGPVDYSQDNGPTGGTVEIYGNTLYNCESDACFSANNFDPTVTVHVHLHNNIIDQPNGGVPYFDVPAAQVAFTSGENNLVFGAGSSITGCGNCTGTVSADPGFVSASTADFLLSTSSRRRVHTQLLRGPMRQVERMRRAV